MKIDSSLPSFNLSREDLKSIKLAIVPKNYFDSVRTDETFRSLPPSLKLKYISLDTNSSKKIIAYFEQGRLVAIGKDNKLLSPEELSEFVQSLLELLKTQKQEEASKAHTTSSKSNNGYQTIYSPLTSKVSFKPTKSKTRATSELSKLRQLFKISFPVAENKTNAKRRKRKEDQKRIQDFFRKQAINNESVKKGVEQSNLTNQLTRKLHLRLV